MSRCFPFPPPGYEKKAKVDDTDLITLTKEKHKEKRHKKDKEKDKKEGSEKKDKDRSKDKNREKKDRKEKHKDKDDRKEKHRDKDKDRDRDRDKEKPRILDDKRIEGQPGSYSGEKLGLNGLQSNEIKDFKYVAELARRISNENGASGSQMVQNVTATNQGRTELQRTAVGSATSSQSAERDKVKNRIEENRKVNGQNIHNDVRNPEKASVQKFFAVDQGRVEAISKLVETKDGGMLVEAREKSKHKEGDGKGDKQKSKEHEKSKKSKDRDKEKERKKEEKVRKIVEHPTIPSALLQDTGALLKDPGALRKDNSSSKLKVTSKNSLDVQNTKPSNPLNLGSTSSIGEGNLGKRKELEINGFLLENGDRPNKSLKTLPSSRPVIENGRKLEPGSVAVQHRTEKQGPGNNHRVDSKEHKRNGLIMSQPVNASAIRISSTNVIGNENGKASTGPIHPDNKEHSINGLIMPQPPSTPLKTLLPSSAAINQNGETSAKPPHPDIKYLSRILSVPKLDELPDLLEDEWLCSNSHSQLKESVRKPPGNDETRQVWSEAIRIESADISALPYVIPY